MNLFMIQKHKLNERELRQTAKMKEHMTLFQRQNILATQVYTQNSSSQQRDILCCPSCASRLSNHNL